MSETFTCTNCGGTFPKKWTDAEAEAEFKKNFHQWAKDKQAVICDSCYEEFMRWFCAQYPASP